MNAQTALFRNNPLCLTVIRTRHYYTTELPDGLWRKQLFCRK